MAERLYLGPVSKQLRGDRDDALTLERTARIKVGYLFDSMMPLQTFKGGSWNLQGGRSITAFVWDDVLGKRATVRLVGVGNVEPLPIEFEPIAFMESGFVTIVNRTEADFATALYLTDDNRASSVGGHPVWLDWLGTSVAGTGAYGSIVRTATTDLQAISWDYDKYYVYPTPRYLWGASSGKLLMLVQAQYGTVYGAGTLSLQDYLDAGGSVKHVAGE